MTHWSIGRSVQKECPLKSVRQELEGGDYFEQGVPKGKKIRPDSCLTDSSLLSTISFIFCENKIAAQEHALIIFMLGLRMDIHGSFLCLKRDKFDAKNRVEKWQWFPLGNILRNHRPLFCALLKKNFLRGRAKNECKYRNWKKN